MKLKMKKQTKKADNPPIKVDIRVPADSVLKYKILADMAGVSIPEAMQVCAALTILRFGAGANK